MAADYGGRVNGYESWPDGAITVADNTFNFYLIWLKIKRKQFN